MTQVRGNLSGLDSFFASFEKSCPFDLTGRCNNNVGSDNLTVLAVHAVCLSTLNLFWGL
jgi:hypothetical protein